MARFIGGGYFCYALIIAQEIAADARVVASWWSPLAVVVVFVPGWLLFVASFSRRLPRTTTTGLPLACGIGYLVGVVSWYLAWNGGHTATNSGTWLVAFPGLAALSLVVTPWPWAALIHLTVATTLVQTASGMARPAHLGPVTVPDVAWGIAFSALYVLAGVMAVKTGDDLDDSKAERVRLAKDAASQRARESERRLFDRMVHDKVLALMRNAHRANNDARVGEQARNLLRDWAALSTDEGSTQPVDGAHVLLIIRLAVQEVDANVDVVEERSTADAREVIVPMRVASALAGATGEAVRNTRRHNVPGTAIDVRADIQSDAVDVRIVDDGVGFDVAAVSRRRTLGLTRSIVERMEDVGGSATIRTAPGEGTAVRLSWPR